ncbi:MAG: hypothetical protein IPL46_17965 [Saprospiraceae bacterium]|nr:hypothetical protein [Saprospiraceae bacterium]
MKYSRTKELVNVTYGISGNGYGCFSDYFITRRNRKVVEFVINRQVFSANDAHSSSGDYQNL